MTGEEILTLVVELVGEGATGLCHRRVSSDGWSFSFNASTEEVARFNGREIYPRALLVFHQSELAGQVFSNGTTAFNRNERQSIEFFTVRLVAAVERARAERPGAR